MKYVLAFLFLSAAPVFAQPAPVSPYPIPGRIVRFGYDYQYPTVTGDLINIAPGEPTAAQNNGVLVGLPSLNASYDCAAKVWTATVYAAGHWAPTVWSGVHTGYYPADNFAHGWLPVDCQPTTTADVITLTQPGQMGILRCHGIDGISKAPGDLQPGFHNGVLFALWATNAHIIKTAQVYHLSVYLGSNGWHEAVYSVDLCDFDPPQ
jgi:hypothetical protein